MKRSISRDKKIAPFSLNLEDLKKLCSELSKEFDNPNDVYISIDVDLPGGVNLQFNSIEEMTGYQSLPDVIDEYEITINDEKREFSLRYPGYFSSKASISTRSEKEVWCIGMIEKAVSALRKHRVWHYWIPRNPFLWASIGIFFILYLIFLNQFSGQDAFWELISTPFGWGCVATIILCSAFMNWTPNNIFPTGEIRMKEKESFMRRHYQELTVLSALAGILVTIIIGLLNFKR